MKSLARSPILGSIGICLLIVGAGRAQTEPPATAPAETATVAPAATSQSQPTSAPESAPASAPALKLVPREAALGEQYVNFNGEGRRQYSGVTWLDDGRHFLQHRDGELMRVDALTNEAAPAYERAALEQALKADPDFDAGTAERLAGQPGQWTDGRDAVLIEHKQHLYIYRFSAKALRKITKDTNKRELIEPSPKGAAVSFVRDNDLYLIDAATGKQTRLTRDGGPYILNGKLDWVYQEEIFGRGQWRASWWSPNDDYLAFFRLDETNVPVYARADYMPLYARVIEDHYPKAGQPNPTIKLGAANRRTGRVAWADLSKYAGVDFLIVRVCWSPANTLQFMVQDREQRWLEFNEADPRTGETRTLIREISPAWTNDNGPPYWLPDRTFLWLSERDGYRHLYHYDRDGRLLGRVTRGDWPVNQIIGYDPAGDWIYFTGFRESPVEQQAYRVHLNGAGFERLTEPGYWHNTLFDPTRKFFIDTFSNATTPTRVHLCRADGSLARVLNETEVKAFEEYVWSAPEIACIPNRRGLPTYARIIRPPNFEAGKKYPVWCEVYGGPGMQSVRNKWNGGGGAFDQYLAQQGYIVFEIDPHSCLGSTAIAMWQSYRRIGDNELQDVEDGLRWLIERGDADPERIGITGGSYGGYLTAYALTHSTMFKVGIAELSPADWRNYDSIYTERYMQTPAHNPEGFTRAELLNAAGNLYGRLLLIHGMMDDNVHFQNAAQFIEALQREKVRFDLMVYPRDGHGIGHGYRHAQRLRLDYLEEHL